MTKLQWLRLAPLIVLLLLALMLSLGMCGHRRDADQLVGSPVPQFNLAVLGTDFKRFSPNLWQGQVAMLTVFASWCQPCAVENPLLLQLAQSGRVMLYGIAWKDNSQKLSAWLAANGNPYQMIGLDDRGQTTVALWLTGVPETFIIGRDGKIAWHTNTALTEETVNNTILPLIDRLSMSNGQ